MQENQMPLSQNEIFDRLPLNASQKRALYEEIMAEHTAITSAENVLHSEDTHNEPVKIETPACSPVPSPLLDRHLDPNQIE